MEKHGVRSCYSRVRNLAENKPQALKACCYKCNLTKIKRRACQSMTAESGRIRQEQAGGLLSKPQPLLEILMTVCRVRKRGCNRHWACCYRRSPQEKHSIYCCVGNLAPNAWGLTLQAQPCMGEAWESQLHAKTCIMQHPGNRFEACCYRRSPQEKHNVYCCVGNLAPNAWGLTLQAQPCM